jgi:two-component system sensor histidine kinase KdpD
VAVLPHLRGFLRLYLGAAAGVGKTYQMLGDARLAAEEGADVVIGYLEPHGRVATEERARGLERAPLLRYGSGGRAETEPDYDRLLERRPSVAIVDELAHTNAAGSARPKRYDDVALLLDHGIDVWTTVNIQHLESLNDVVASFTQVRVRETLPDRVLENAEIEIVDIPPDELIERLKQGKVYVPAEATRALNHFFSKSNLSALRELALRRAAQAVDAQMLDYVRAHALAGTWAGGERLVVAMSEQPASAELIRAAKRMADALRAPWTAVHIETARNAQFSDAEHGALASAMHLAAQLGGQAVTVPAESILDGLKRVTLEARATQLIVGKSTRSRWFELRHGSVVDRLVRETPGVAVHVLPMSEAAQSQRGRRPMAGAWGRPWGYLVSLTMTALVTLLGIAIFRTGSITNIGLLYLIPVMIAATRYGLRTGIVTGLVCSLAYNFFFIPPLYTFTIQNPENIVTVLVLLGVAVVGSQLAARVREQAMLAQRSAAQNSSLAGFAKLLTGVRTHVELAQLLCAEVGRLFDVRASLLIRGPDGLDLVAAVPPENSLEAIELAAAQWALDTNTAAGQGSDTLTASEWLFQPIAAGGRAHAVLGLARSDARAAIRSDQLPLLLSLLDQAGLAFERIALEAEMATVSQLKERDRLRAALLSSVSHDLRTPLTTVLGMLGEMRPHSLEEATHLAATRGEAERLHRFVANLLDMVRIESGALHQSIEPVDLTEAVSAAVHDLRGLLADHAVKIEVAPDLPLVLVDPQLFHHCLINLLENAAKYAPAGSAVIVRARRLPGGLTLTLIDEGQGIPTEEETRIFETFTRIEGSDRKGGTGLGLAIVKGFTEAMGLGVEAANRADRPGSCFTIRFPESKLRIGEELAR